MRARSFFVGVILAAGLASPAVSSAAFIATFEQISPTATVYARGTDFQTFADNGGAVEGDVTASLQAVDLGLNSGCESGDFAGFSPGAIALIERGSCTFALKVLNAAAAGAVGALIFNNITGAGAIEGTLGETSTMIPALFLSDPVGESFRVLLTQGAVTVHMSITRVPEPAALALLALALGAMALGRRRALR